jgi:zinc transporter 13
MGELDIFFVCVSKRQASFFHEIPHELGDFAILMKSGFSRSEAAKAQFSTAFVGIIGAIMALVLDWTRCGILAFFIVPFTCGGFLHISMVSVLPALLESDDLKDCCKVMSGILCGLGSMYCAATCV